MHKLIFALTAVAVTTLSGCAAFTEHSVGVLDGQFSDCPAWPRCVSSDSNVDEKFVPPLKITGDVNAAWQAARETVANMERTEIVKKKPDYLHAEVISPWHFYTDDLELNLRPSEKIIAVRSSGRIGYFDFHVNRDRVEALRATLAERGVVEPANN